MPKPTRAAASAASRILELANATPADTIIAWLETTDLPYLRLLLPCLASGIHGLGDVPFSGPYYWAGFGAFGGA